MKTKKIDVQDKKLLVVSPIYNRMDKLLALESIIQPDHIVVLLGDSCFPYKTFSEIPERINEIRLFLEKYDSHYILGDKDVLFMKKTLSTHADTCDWLGAQQAILRFDFPNQTSALVLHGGILSQHTTWSELSNDLEVLFIEKDPNINKPWHKTYNGRFGFVLSAHPAMKDNKALKYKHSISLDTSAFDSDSIAAQEYTKNGLGQIFYL